MRELRARHGLEQLDREVMRGAVSGRSVVELSRIGLGIVEQLLDVLERMLGIDHHHVGHVGHHRERNEIALQAVRQLGVEGLGDRVMHRAHEPGVAVGQRLGRVRRAHGAARASLVLDEHGLAEGDGELCGERPGESIGSAARGKGIDDAYGLRGPALRERRAG